jgi:hypothetical protein
VNPSDNRSEVMMQSYVNQPFLDKRSNLARLASYAGLGALFVGVLTSSRSLFISYGFLILGVIVASIGAYLSNRYVKEPRADQALAKALDGLDKRYALYNYYLPASHVIASHFGLMVLMPRPQKGKITFQKGKWEHRTRWRRMTQFFGEPTVGRPELALADDLDPVTRWIADAMPGEEAVPVSGVVIFTDPKAELDVSSAPVTAMRADALGDYMREGLKGQPVLSTSRQKELRRLLDGVVEESAAASAKKKKGKKAQ